eukprot:4581354-Alexandrium_andersonii.AAC.1
MHVDWLGIARDFAASLMVEFVEPGGLIHLRLIPNLVPGRFRVLLDSCSMQFRARSGVWLFGAFEQCQSGLDALVEQFQARSRTLNCFR